MRLTLRFLVKSFLVVLVFLFLLPVLLNHLESGDRDEHRTRINIKKRSGADPGNNGEGGALRFQPFHIPPIGGPDDHNDHQQAPAPVINQEDEAGEAGAGEAPQRIGDKALASETPKVYGPKAEYKSGTLGNFEPTNLVDRGGPGANGEPVYTSMAEKAASDKSIREFGFNMVVSDKIAMDRLIPDTRHDECKYWHYPEDLPTASVILVFHNEGFTTLVRTVHSVINMSPPNLLHEVIMVDDFSDKEHLKGQLEEYLEQFNGKVKLFRNPERLGLIMTRTLGAKYASGDVIVFLDAHCECNRNWLVPLLARIRYDRKIMAVPIVDGIDWNNMAYKPVYQKGESLRGIFEWGFLYKESHVPRKELNKRQHNSEPYWAPTHAGGLFAMDRSYFFELGAYDPGLQIWGGENFELSFKIWLCGGSIEWVPCSRVGHIYRNHMPYGFGKISSKIPVISLNYMRVVEVWLDDEFKEYFYTREPTIRGYPIGNITEQLEFKKKHQVHSFKWFMDNIAYEVWDKFPAPPPNVAWGEFKQRSGNLCLDTMGQQVNGGAMGATSCHHYGGNQLYRLNEKGQLATGERCIDNTGDSIHMIICPVQPSGPWSYDKDSGLIQHKQRQKCLQSSSGSSTVSLSSCDATNVLQQWDVKETRTWQR